MTFKCKVFCIYFPCDTAPELKTFAPSGYVDVFPRKIDLDNVKRLKNFFMELIHESYRKPSEIPNLCTTNNPRVFYVAFEGLIL